MNHQTGGVDGGIGRSAFLRFRVYFLSKNLIKYVVCDQAYQRGLWEAVVSCGVGGAPCQGQLGTRTIADPTGV